MIRESFVIKGIEGILLLKCDGVSIRCFNQEFFITENLVLGYSKKVHIIYITMQLVCAFIYIQYIRDVIKQNESEYCF